MNFRDLQLHKTLSETLEKLGIVTPTPIQEAAIPLILEGKDIRASAQTGTGKTAAFLLPVLHRLIQKQEAGQKAPRGPRVLILAPTRELASQIALEVTKFTANLPYLKTVCIFGGTSYTTQNKQLNRPYDILIATPGRLIDQLDRKHVQLGNVETLIFDEADRMLDMGFVEPVMRITKQTPLERQTLLFSATLKGSVFQLSEKILKNPVRVEVETTAQAQAQITEHFRAVNDINHKHTQLIQILSQPDMNQAIIFTATKRSAEKLATKLSQEGYETTALHGDMRQNQRLRTIHQVKTGKIRILVATDVAARGIDIQSITHVINFDLPMNAEDYVHRIGRTGRAGKTGQAFSFASSKDRYMLREIEKLTGQSISLLKEKNFPQKSSFSPRQEGRRESPRGRAREGQEDQPRRFSRWKGRPGSAPSRFKKRGQMSSFRPR